MRGSEDTLSYAQWGGDVSINMRLGEATGLNQVEGFNRLVGGAGHDRLVASDQTEQIIGGAGDDVISVSQSVERADGGLGSNVLDGLVRAIQRPSADALLSDVLNLEQGGFLVFDDATIDARTGWPNLSISGFVALLSQANIDATFDEKTATITVAGVTSIEPDTERDEGWEVDSASRLLFDRLKPTSETQNNVTVYTLDLTSPVGIELTITGSGQGSFDFDGVATTKGRLKTSRDSLIHSTMVCVIPLHWIPPV